MFYFLSFLTVVVMIVFILETRKPKNYPPGPQWLPFIGSALHISQLRSKCGMLCKAIDELHKIYLNPNGLFGLKFGADMLVVAYSAAAIKELGTNEDLDGRPNSVFYRTRTFGKKIGILTVDGDLWQEHRRFIMRHLKNFGFAGRGMLNIIEHEAEMIVKELKDGMKKAGTKETIVDMKEFFHVFVLNNIWKMMTGIRYDRNSKEVNEILMMFTKLLQDVDMVGTLFSHFPFLRFVAPVLSGYEQFVENHTRFYGFLRKEVQRHRQNFVQSDEPKDLLDSYLQEIDHHERDESSTFIEEQLLAVCLDLFLAGSETTNKSLGFAFLHMTLKPEIQDKAYNELTSVLGDARYPSWEDKPNLPYCDAIVHEGLRFFMGHTFGVPHRALMDTRLCGYNIPKVSFSNSYI